MEEKRRDRKAEEAGGQQKLRNPESERRKDEESRKGGESMGVEEKEKKVIEELTLLEDGASQCEYLMFLGMQREKNEDLQRNCYRIEGCKTAIWIKAWCDKGRVHFQGDSDSLLVRGVLAVLEDLYEGESPEAVRAHPPEFPKYISDEVIYPEIKRNGILKCYQRLAALNK